MFSFPFLSAKNRFHLLLYLLLHRTSSSPLLFSARSTKNPQIFSNRSSSPSSCISILSNFILAVPVLFHLPLLNRIISPNPHQIATKSLSLNPHLLPQPLRILLCEAVPSELIFAIHNCSPKSGTQAQSLADKYRSFRSTNQTLLKGSNSLIISLVWPKFSAGCLQRNLYCHGYESSKGQENEQPKIMPLRLYKGHPFYRGHPHRCGYIKQQELETEQANALLSCQISITLIGIDIETNKNGKMRNQRDQQEREDEEPKTISVGLDTKSNKSRKMSNQRFINDMKTLSWTKANDFFFCRM